MVTSCLVPMDLLTLQNLAASFLMRKRAVSSPFSFLDALLNASLSSSLPFLLRWVWCLDQVLFFFCCGHALLQLLGCFIFIIIVFCVFLDFVLKGQLPQLLQVVFLHVPFWTASFFKGFPFAEVGFPFAEVFFPLARVCFPFPEVGFPFLQRLISLPFS